jgi:hypothetical protein
MMKTLNDEQAQNTVSRMMNSLATRIQKQLRRATGQDLAFSLVVFAPSDKTLTSYISNAPRKEVQQALRQLLDYWDEGGPDVKAHDRH